MNIIMHLSIHLASHLYTYYIHCVVYVTLVISKQNVPKQNFDCSLNMNIILFNVMNVKLELREFFYALGEGLRQMTSKGSE